MAMVPLARFQRSAFIIGNKNNGFMKSTTESIFRSGRGWNRNMSKNAKLNSMPGPYGMGMDNVPGQYNVYQEDPIQPAFPYPMNSRQQYGFNRLNYGNGRYPRYDGAPNSGYNDSRPYSSRYGTQRPYNSYNREYSSFGNFHIEPVDWNNVELVEIKKDFYDLSYEADSRPGDEIEEILKRDNIIIEGDVPLPKPVNSFDEAVFNEPIQKIISRFKFVEPTPIQKVGWTSCLTGRDVVGVSQTGSGKTLTFLLPGLLHLLAQPPAGTAGPIVLILAPTRELCLQISQDASPYLAALNLRGVTIYGGVSKYTQQNQLMNGCDLMVATPGRLLDFLRSGVVKLSRVSYFVMDEADRMLEMGFEPQIRKIVHQIRPDRQTLMFSATWPKDIRQLASEFCKNNCIYIQVGGLELTANPNIRQTIHILNSNDIKNSLFRYLETEGEQKKILIFTDFKSLADQLAAELKYRNLNARSLHGDKTQASRERILRSFRDGECNILVATDVAARGLDIKDIDCIINLDAPKNMQDYIHRIGRTARGKKTGESILYISTDAMTPAKLKFIQDLVPMLRGLGQPVSPELQSLASN